jgi:hypothetical protein
MRFNVITESSPDEDVTPVNACLLGDGTKLSEITAAKLQRRKANALGGLGRC